MAEKTLIVGLGNPGRKYEDHRHNVGFMVVSEVARRAGATFGRTRASALYSETTIAGQNVILAKPQTFMNTSGQSVGQLVKFYKLDLTRLLVVYDEVDLPVGVLRLRAEGGHGGHNGMRSIIQHLGGNEFPRLRVGVGRPAGGGPVGPDYVLKPFSKAQAPIMELAIQTAADAVEAFIQHDIEYAMNRFNKTVA